MNFGRIRKVKCEETAFGKLAKKLKGRSRALCDRLDDMQATLDFLGEETALLRVRIGKLEEKEIFLP
jgi:hypothetical protein